ncbi:MAG: transferase hexapeptide repeat containing protein [Cyanobacteria bacterium RYN_339]|nr:transferase hexapeptide repeat containing protein [Cyanobacteria bacterium RYN_339]
MSDVVFWGATGQAKVLRECLGPQTRLVALFDNDPTAASPFADVPIFYGKAGFEAWLAARPERPACLVAIGGHRGADRVALQAYMVSLGLPAATACHPTAFVATDARIGAGSQILAQAAVCVEARLGLACIVNTAASVDHECILGDGVHIAPGARLAGCVEVGDGAMIGTGAIVLPRVRIGAGAIIGAGAVVVRDVPAGAVAMGNPARVKEER